MKNWILTRIRDKATKAHNVQIFDELFLDLYLLSFAIRLFTSVFSLFTGFYFMLGIFSAQMNGSIKYVLASMIVLMVESLKYYITPKAFNNLFKGKLVYGLPTLIVGIPLYLASVYFTINGVKNYFDDNNEDIEIAVSEKKDIVNNQIVYYDSLIAVEQKKYDKLMEQHEGTRRMGWLKVMEQFEKVENRMDNYRIEKNEILQETKAEEDIIVEEVVKKTNLLKGNIVYISISSESLLFLTFLFVQFYLYKSYKDDSKRIKESIKLPEVIDKNFLKKKSVIVSIPSLGTVTVSRDRLKQLSTKKKKRIDQVRALYNGGVKDAGEIAKILGTHKQYVYTLLRKINNK